MNTFHTAQTRRETIVTLDVASINTGEEYSMKKSENDVPWRFYENVGLTNRCAVIH